MVVVAVGEGGNGKWKWSSKDLVTIHSAGKGERRDCGLTEKTGAGRDLRMSRKALPSITSTRVCMTVH